MLLATPVTTVGGEAKPTAFAVPLTSKTAETRSAIEILTTNGLSMSIRTPQPTPDLHRNGDDDRKHPEQEQPDNKVGSAGTVP